MIRAVAAAAAPLREASAWLAGPAGRPVVGLLAALLAGQIFFAGYEVFFLGFPVVREEPAGFAPHFLVQSLFLLAACAWLVVALVQARSPSSSLESDRAAPVGLLAGLAAMVAAAAATLLLVADPLTFHAVAQEDRPLEWASALLLLAGSGLLALGALRRRGGRVTVLMAVGLCGALAILGMEEISWGQRLFGFVTPEKLAEVNWQQEFNLHNVQTDLFETLYYAGAALFLIALPLLRDLLPVSVTAHPLLAFVPRREIALLSAPLVWFDYGHWDLYVIQLGAMLALFALPAWAWAARRRGDHTEAAVFVLAAVGLVIGKLAFLAWGSSVIDLPDPTEYKEFFSALGFAAYAVNVAARPTA